MNTVQVGVVTMPLKTVLLTEFIHVAGTRHYHSLCKSFSHREPFPLHLIFRILFMPPAAFISGAGHLR